MIYKLDKTFVRNTIRTSTHSLNFRYNTSADYFYFDLYTLTGATVSLHNKVVTGWDFGGFSFASSLKASYANADNITSFKMVTDG